ncbi:MAG: segregation/condensation protein A [Verrucomicrobiales bacterium]|jgi:segregation and condensation protein A|nr:segregation/condensation protein A [Verrucomicrobiales bacterium]
MMDLATADWKVRLPVFEGPLDLLLYLIKKEEVDIYAVELGKICDQYLAYIDSLERMEIEVAGEFLVIAATLVYLKSRTLLPVDQQLPVDEEEDGEDPRLELIRQLVEYKKFKDAAAELSDRQQLQEKLFHRDVPPDLPKPERPALGEVSTLDLVKAFQKILQRIREQQGFKEIEAEQFTVSQKIEIILRRIEDEGTLPFSTLFAEYCSRAELAVTFLAVLELVRLKQIRVRQSEAFGEIELVRPDLAPALQQCAEPTYNSSPLAPGFGGTADADAEAVADGEAEI